MAIVSEEVLLGRLRRESAARAAELAKLRVELAALGAQIEERIDRLAARFRSTVGGKTTDSSALIESIRRVVAGEGYALAEIVDRLEARVGDQAAATAEEFLRARVTATTALAEWGVILTARIAENHAYATTTLQAYADTASALAEQVTELDTAINDPATGLVVSQASASTTLSAHSTQISSVAGRTSTLEAQVQTPGGGLLARVSTVETAKVDAAGASAAATSVVSASLASGASGTIGAAVTTAAIAYVTPLNEVRAQWGVKIESSTGRILGRIKLDASEETSTLDFDAGTIRLWNGTSDVAPFDLSDGVLKLTNVTVDTLAANIEIYSPKILGGMLRLASDCIVCADTADGADVSLVRINGGGAHNTIRGGQLDCFGNEHAVAPGSVYISPGEATGAEVRIRDRTGADRIAVRATGFTEILGDIHVTGHLSAVGTIGAGALQSSGPVACGGGSSSMVHSASGRLYLGTGSTPRWFVSDSTGDLNCVGNHSVKKETSDGYTIRLSTGSMAVEFGESGGHLTYRIDGGTPRVIHFT